ncbi:alpha/beta hydrolase fold domain-containing protein [Luteimonas sp. XNQY3]|nr:alpha/beta hydrolase fold domain-containing protein [Luteimonas sp. XNQY3]MCD9004745.1 alpha/beta hydrolase fold domain-containing protein [Luteimonas sp. XNQY3]
MSSTPPPAGTPHDDVAPEIRQFQQCINAGYASAGDFARLPLDDARRAAERIRAPWTRGGPTMARTTSLPPAIAGVGVRIHHPGPPGAALPALVYLHGGGWTMFSVDTHDRLMREYAARAGIAVVGVDYSLAPDAKFPQPIAETAGVLAWLRRHGDAYAIDGTRMLLGGDSAGANLSVATSLWLRQHDQPQVLGMLLNYGAFDREPSASWHRYDGPRYMLEVGEMHRFWDNYLRDDADRLDPLAEPMRGDLRGLPPAFFAIAECDILADGNRRLAAGLEAAGVAVEVKAYPGATHSFLEAVSISPLAGRAFDDAAHWLRATVAA